MANLLLEEEDRESWSAGSGGKMGKADVLGFIEQWRAGSAGGEQVKRGATFEGVSLVFSCDGLMTSTGTILIGSDSFIWDGSFLVGDGDTENATNNVSPRDSGLNHGELETRWKGIFPAATISKVEKYLDSPGGPKVAVGLAGETKSDLKCLFFKFVHESESKAKYSAERFHNLLSCLCRSVQVRDLHSGCAAELEDDGRVRRQESPKSRDKRRLERRKKKERRGSINFEGIRSFIEQNEPSEVEMDNSAIKDVVLEEPVKQEEEVNLEEPVKPMEDLNLKDLVRQFVKNPGEFGDHTQRALELNGYTYELSTIPTPTKERLIESPVRNLQPKRKELKKLKPIVVDMTERVKLEKIELEQATHVSIHSPRGKDRAIRYVDQYSNQRIHPSEYANRYLQYIHGKKTSDSEVLVSVNEEMAPSQPTTSGESVSPNKDSKIATGSVSKEETMDIVPKEETTSHVPKEEVSYEPGNYEEALALAEALLHKEFDTALNKFLSAKEKLQIKFGESAAHNDCQEEVVRNVQRRSKHRATRRRSLNFDDVLPLFESNGNTEDNSSTETKASRVIWSAKP